MTNDRQAAHSLVPLLVRRSEIIGDAGNTRVGGPDVDEASPGHDGADGNSAGSAWIPVNGQTRVTAVEAETTDDA
jgi:hypothetical protein